VSLFNFASQNAKNYGLSLKNFRLRVTKFLRGFIFKGSLNPNDANRTWTAFVTFSRRRFSRHTAIFLRPRHIHVVSVQISPKLDALYAVVCDAKERTKRSDSITPWLCTV